MKWKASRFPEAENRKKILSYMKKALSGSKGGADSGQPGSGLSGTAGRKSASRPFPAPAVGNTTAAGDTFTGYFIHGIACQDSVRKKSGIRGESRSHCRVQKRSCRFHPLGRGSGSFRKFRMNLFCRNAAAPVKCHGRGGIFSLPVAKRHNLLYNA